MKLAKARFAFFVDLGTLNLERFGRVFGGDLRATVDPLHAFAGFAPDDGTTRTHQPHEWFRVMRRVQRDETHSLPHSRQDALDDGVGYFTVCGVAPPDQNISTLENAGG